MDGANGYEAIAAEYIASRPTRRIGESTVAEWAAELPDGAAVLDLGCGSGEPIAAALAARGLAIYGVDASPMMIAAFQTRFPNAHAECLTVEASTFFGRKFDAIVAWGLLFLLPPTTQRELIGKMARALESGGKLPFTAPWQVCSWRDAMTGSASMSLGWDEYGRVLGEAGFELDGFGVDEGENHYYLATRR